MGLQLWPLADAPFDELSSCLERDLVFWRHTRLQVYLAFSFQNLSRALKELWLLLWEKGG